MKYHYFFHANCKTKYSGEKCIAGMIALDFRVLANNGSYAKFIEAVERDITDLGFDLFGLPEITTVAFLHATEDE